MFDVWYAKDNEKFQNGTTIGKLCGHKAMIRLRKQKKQILI